MKIKTLLVLVSIFFFLTRTQAQAHIAAGIKEGEVEYAVFFGKKKNSQKILKKTSDSLKVSKESIFQIVKMLLSNNQGRQIIKFNEGKSLSMPEFVPEIKAKKDFNMAKIILEVKGIYYADVSQNLVYNEENNKGDIAVAKYIISDLQWNITDKVDVINGYKATKAVAKYKFQKKRGKLEIREVVAWFSEEIPIKVAPERFYGLPGLVVKLEAGGLTYILNSIQEKKVNLEYKMDTEKALSEDEYIEQYKNSNK